MARPKDWHPLRESDPVPGDPEGIRDQVKHMKKIAEYLRTQAAALTAMADADNLKGEFADELAEDARGLGRKLDQAEDRYREVKGHLSNWADELEEFQRKADKALGDAQDAQRVIDSLEAKADDKPDSDKKKDKDGGGGSATGEDPELKRAKEDLEDARKRLNTAAGDYDERAGHFASKIRSSIDDDMKDSLWNDIKGWVADADWLDKAADWMSLAATIVGVAAMFFPFLGPLALALTIAVTLIHVTQAATGNGSWFDVVMDIGALKLVHNGIKAAKAVKALQKSSRNVASGLANDTAKSAATQARKGAMNNARRGSQKGGGRSGGDRAKNRARHLKMEQKNRVAGKKAGNEVRDAELPQITAREKVDALGDKALGRQMKDIKKWRDEYPDNSMLADNARQAERHKDVVQGSWAASTVLDVADKSGDGVSSGEYSRMKDRMTAPMGSQW